MKTVNNEQVIYFDVDDTLVVWGKIKKGQKMVKIIDPYSKDMEHHLRMHLGHIKVLKDRKARGAYIVVWSAGGYRWAEAVVKALKLTDYVDMVMSKPIMYVDDCKAEEILGERLYLGLDSQYGT